MPSRKDKILVIGASGQIGVELTLALRKMYGNTNVVASDMREENTLLRGSGPYVTLDVLNKGSLHVQVIRQNITQIYLLAAILSADPETKAACHINAKMQPLRLEVNSSHHQAAAAQGVGDGLRVSATCPSDGVVEALEGTHPGHFVLAVQWHPERSYDADAPSRALFRAFVRAAAREQQ